MPITSLRHHKSQTRGTSTTVFTTERPAISSLTNPQETHHSLKIEEVFRDWVVSLQSQNSSLELAAFNVLRTSFQNG